MSFADSDSIGLGKGLSFCISKKFSGVLLLLVHRPHGEQEGSRAMVLDFGCTLALNNADTWVPVPGTLI